MTLTEAKTLLKEKNYEDQKIIKKFKDDLKKDIAYVLANNGEQAMKADLKIKRRNAIFLLLLNENENGTIEELIKEREFYNRFLLEQKPWMPRTSSVLTNLLNALYAEVTAEIITELDFIIEKVKQK